MAGAPGLEPGTRTPEPYRVLARKYRPQTFDSLIGQEAMVRTLRNAFARGRIAHGFILTGVRGVGKTTTARIIAKGLNCTGRGDRPTVDPCGACAACVSIAESRAMDVLEMDAASRTGIDDIREIIEGARYAPAETRYKVYIIDEVHMLSKAAFNGLLKTLEEPPPHVVFIFATTEIRRVPVTVLSRCQRFDLRRVDMGVLIEHLRSIAAREGVPVEEGALALLARAAEGSVRDALSLLDQAIAHAAHTETGAVAEAAVREILGLVDRTRLFDLFEAVMAGRTAEALTVLSELYEAGGDPLVLLQDLLTLSHAVTRQKLVPEGPPDLTASEAELARTRVLAARLPVNMLTRAYSLLLKGILEAQGAPDALAAAEMVVVRLAFAADLPTPDEALRALKADTQPGAPLPGPSHRPPPGASSRSRTSPLGSAVASAPVPLGETALGPEARFTRLEEVVARAAAERDVALKTQLEDYVHLVRFEAPHIEFNPAPGAPNDLAGRLAERLQRWTGRRWTVSVVADAGAPTLSRQMSARDEALKADAAREPLVAAALRIFPGAEVIAVRDVEGEDALPDLGSSPDADDPRAEDVP